MGWIQDAGKKISGSVKTGVDELVDFVKDPVEGFENAGEELRRWRDNVRNLSPAGVSEELWGEGGRFAYPAGAAIMSKRSPTGVPLADSYKGALRPYFGDVVDRVTIHWATPPLDEWAADKFSISLEDTDTEAQTFGHDIYVKYGEGEKATEDELSLLAHELVHALQYEKYGRSFSNFGYHYFKEYKKAGLDYSGNDMEEEAYRRQEEFDSAWRLAWQVPPIAITQLGGSLYVIENKTRALYRVDPNTGSFRSLGQHWAVAPIAMTALGESLYIIENKTLFRVDPNTGSYKSLGQHWAVGPIAMAALGDRLYIIENKTLFGVDPKTGGYQSLGQHWAVAPIAMTALGDSLYIIENKTLFRVDPSTGSYKSLGQHWAVAPIAMAALGNHLYIIENQALFRVDPNSGSYTNLGQHWAVEPIMTALGNSLYIIENQTLFRVDPSSGSYQRVG